MSFIRPIPDGRGIGFMVIDPPDGSLPDFEEWKTKYQYEKTGRYHNFLFTKDSWHWPLCYVDPNKSKIMDGFSPNLNKELHVGHLRNLATANAFYQMLPKWKFVALLGASQGVCAKAMNGLQEWFNFVGY